MPNNDSLLELLLQQVHGEKAKEEVSRLLKDQTARTLLHQLSEGGGQDPALGGRKLAAYTDGKRPLAEAAECLDAGMKAVEARVQMGNISREEAPARVTHELLPKALRQLAAVKTDSTMSDKLALVQFDPSECVTIADRVELYRGVLSTAASHAEKISRNTAFFETRGRTLLDRAYGKIRAAVLADLDLAPALSAVEEVLFGAAQKGVGTRQENQSRLDEMSKKAADQGRATARREAQRDAASEVRDLLDELQKKDEATPPDPRNRPR